MTRTIRRLIAIVVLAASLLVGAAVTADAGEICGRLDLLRPVDRLKVCAPTY
jgi:hypothetical protein